MFRKLLALEVAALNSKDETGRNDRADGDMLGTARETFTPRTGNYGSMWSTRSFG